MIQKITGILLAGGKASRLGGKDKGLLWLHDKPLYLHVLRKLTPQVKTLMISANRNLSTYQTTGLTVFKDITFTNFSGPIAAILSAMQQKKQSWLVFVPCDTPFIPDDLVSVLWRGKGNAPAAYIHDGIRPHPILLLIHCCLSKQLHDYLAKGEHKLISLLHNLNASPILYKHPDYFLNINTICDYLQAMNYFYKKLL